MENKIISILKGFNDHQSSKSFQCCWLWRRMWTLKCMQNGNELRINILFASNKNTAFPSTSLQKILRNRSPANFHQALCIIQYSNFINRWEIKLEALNLLQLTPPPSKHTIPATQDIQQFNEPHLSTFSVLETFIIGFVVSWMYLKLR